MKSIHTLVINGTQKREIALNAVFDQLNYLSVKRVTFSNSTLLTSANIHYLIFGSTRFSLTNAVDSESDNETTWIKHLGFDNLMSRNIRYLQIIYTLDCDFFKFCAENHLLDYIDEMKVNLTDFETLVYLSENFPSLRKINCLIGDNELELLRLARKTDLKKITSRLRDNLSVYLLGFLFNASTETSVVNLLRT